VQHGVGQERLHSRSPQTNNCYVTNGWCKNLWTLQEGTVAAWQL